MPYIIEPNIGRTERADMIREPSNSNMDKFIKEKEALLEEKGQLEEENKTLKKEVELLNSKLEALSKTTNTKISNKKSEKAGE